MKTRNVFAIVSALSLTPFLSAEETPGPLPSPVPVRTGQSKPLLRPQANQKADIAHTFRPATFRPAASSAASPVNMKILVLAGDASEISYHAITAFLDEIGVPYTAVAVDTITPDSNGNRLASFPFTDPVSGRGLYQGMIYTNSTFGVCSPTCVNLLSAADWTTLDNYSAQYQVRVVSYYTWPEAKWGLVAAGNGASYTTTNPLNASFTPAAAAIFPYLTRTNPLPIGANGTGIYAYQATTTAAAGETTTPILTDGNYTLGATHTTADGRQTLALTFDNDVALLHSLALNYGVINWVTNGVFIGSRQIYFNPQIDDILIGDRLYDPTVPTCPAADTCPTDYTTATDLQAYENWQTSIQGEANFQAFRSSFSIVGIGTSSEYSVPDQTVLPLFPGTGHNFWWVTHTYDHLNFDCYSTDANGNCLQATSTQALYELNQNATVTNSLGLTTDVKSIVTPYNTGLDNLAFVQGAASVGIQYVIDPNAPPSPNTGLINTLDPAIQQVPRLANNIYYDADVPASGVPGSEVDEYNSNYGPNGVTPTFSTNQTYTQVISNESDAELANMLQYLAFPFALHISNIFAYDGTNSLASDFMGATISKYNALCNLPVKSMVMSDIGALIVSRAQYNASGVTGVYTPGASVVLTTVNAASIPVTGVCSQSSCPTYGGQIQDSVAMAANSTVTISLNGSQGVAISTLTLNPTSVTGGTASQGTVTLTGPAPAAGAVVTLSSNNPAATVPSSVSFTANSTTATFPVATTAVTTSATATITATYNSGTKTATFTVQPQAVTLSGVSVNPTSVTGGSPSTGTVTLSGGAPANGIVVSLSSNSKSATVNATVTVPVGSSSATFPITTTAVTASTTATITAAYSGVSEPASLTILPPAVTLSGVSVNPTSVTGGTSSTGTVTLSGAAPAGGVTVSLSSSASATVNATVTVPAGSSTATFTITTTAVTATTTATITAAYSGVTKTVSLTVTPPAIALSGVSLNPTSVTGGTSSTGTVTLSGAAPAGGVTVSLSSSASATVNATVTVPAGSSTATFPITTTAVTATITATITAAYSGVTKTVSLTVTPPAIALSGVSLNPTSVTGGTSSTGTVTLSAAAPTGGIVVSLSSSASATVNASVTVAAGGSTATFTINTTAVTTSTTATITAAYGGATKTASLTVTPPAIALSGVSVNPASVTGGTSSTGSVTLSGAAPAAIVVSLSSNSASATVGTSVTVAAGSSTATFTITTTPAAAAATATITAVYNSVNKTASLTITAVPVTLSSLSLNPTTVTGGKSSTGTVTLSEPAPAGGITVSLGSSSSQVASVPASITIPAGSQTGTFTIATERFLGPAKQGAGARQTTISAKYGDVSKTATLTVNP
jgi:hypothetical protein